MSQNLTKAEQKARIRERYKGIDTSDMEVIPATKKTDFYDDVKRRVGVYVRVSTDNIQQTSSYELQKNYYEDKVQRNENWELVEIYADEGISGTSLNHRDAFNRMISDCRAGKIDMVITKSVSRFARNIVDCVTIVRELSQLKNPVGVFFETENIFTLNDTSEMALNFTATMAQEESHVKSSIMNASIEMRFSHGILLTPVLLGYDHDKEGNLVVNEDEALTIRLIFFMYLYGYTTQEIADTLTRLKRLTKKGNMKWSSSTVTSLLRNERYCGDVLTRKTFTPSYLTHRSKKNMGDRTQHRWKDHHEAIITRDDFIAVQHKLNNARYGGGSVLPELKVIQKGPFKGFVRVNTHWAVFKPRDYLRASNEVYAENEPVYTYKEEYKIEATTGQFDLRGFEIARSQFFENKGRLTATFSITDIKFSMSCVKKLNNCQYIEIYIHPEKKLMYVRDCGSDSRNGMKWARFTEKGMVCAKNIKGPAFLDTIFELFDWKKECKYRFQGVKKTQSKKSIIIFDFNETELLVPKATIENMGGVMEPMYKDRGKSIIGIPSTWGSSFGNEYYVHNEKQDKDINEKKWDSKDQAINYTNMPELNITSEEKIATNIREIISNMKGSESDECRTADNR